ncbi:MAG TPA: geranylgeranylglyceryl/heptaprenylglyceryl phosphate synthase [Bacteroidales bacterium]|nr:geranylgeranylglyceryl/heptaprenylglyceryl phosphate synthase [Bacteroidales bacterium]
MSIYSTILEKTAQGGKQLAVLVDPDKLSLNEIGRLSLKASNAGVDYFFVGGSLLVNNQLDACIKTIKENTQLPVILFPGNTMQLSWKADAILFLSLISGRNAEMLIGRHVISAPYLKISPLEVISCGYMLIESGKQTAVQYMSNTTPIPSDKNDIAICTALAGEMLGLKLIYLEAGSGAQHTVPEEMVKQVKGSISVPLIVGGGIRTPEKVNDLCRAGADLLVVGTAFEHNDGLIEEISAAVHETRNE